MYLAELIIGILVCLAALVFGILRIAKTPNNYNFSKKANQRYLIFTIIALTGGIALIVFGLLGLLA